MALDTILIAAGGNAPGKFGSVDRTFVLIAGLLRSHGVHVVLASPLYKTAPLGSGLQPAYLNGVLAVETPHPPAELLRRLKAIEREAGRRFGRHWGPRPLDLDLIAYGSRILGWPAPGLRNHGRLILPHPELHRRVFVLRPLRDIAPHWRHPALGVSASNLLKRLNYRRGDIRAMVDFAHGPWQKNGNRS